MMKCMQHATSFVAVNDSTGPKKISDLSLAITFFLVVCSVGSAHAITITNPLPSAYPHTVDGQFTDWPPATPGAPFEWFDIKPMPDVHPSLGLLGYVYDDYQGNWLYKLNDWTISNGALNPTDDNMFFIETLDGFDQWVLTVASNPGQKAVTCTHNGVACNANTFQADYGVVSTPNKMAPHSVWEIALDIGRRTELLEYRLDPVVPGGPMVGTAGEHVLPLPSGGTQVIPEPASLVLLTVGLAVWSFLGWRKHS